MSIQPPAALSRHSNPNNKTRIMLGAWRVPRRGGFHPAATRVALVPIAVAVVIVAIGSRDHDAGGLVQNQLSRAFFTPIVEVEHVVDRSGDGIERAARLD